jgi:hypothetical protein
MAKVDEHVACATVFEMLTIPYGTIMEGQVGFLVSTRECDYAT